MNEELMKQVKSLIEENKEWEARLLITENVKELNENDLKDILILFPFENRYRYDLVEKYVQIEEREKYINFVDDYYKVDIISNLNVEKQLKYKSLMENIIKNEEREYEKLKMLGRDNLSDEIIMSLLKYMQNYKIQIIWHVSDKNKLKYIIENYFYPYNSKEIYSIIEHIRDEKIISVLLFTMKVLDKKELQNFRGNSNIVSDDFIRNNFFKFIELELDDKNDVEKAKETMVKIIDEVSDNNLRTMDINALSSKYIQKTHLDEMLMFIQYDYTKYLTNLTDNEIKILLKCIEHYKATTSSNNWNNLAGKILSNLYSKSYKDLLNSIEDIDKLDLNKREQLYKILQNPNFLELTDIKQLDNIDSIKEDKCNELIKGKLDDKKNALLIKLFGINLGYALELNYCFSDIEKFENIFLKKYLETINAIINIKDEKQLEELFNESYKIMNVDRSYVEDQIRTEYGKMFNKNLFVPNETNLISKEKNMYDTGTDFNMIVSVIGSIKFHDTENYYKDWNRSLGDIDSNSNMFCASYIRFNSLGTANGHTHVTYGFNNLEPSTMVGCSCGDAGTHSNGFNSMGGKGFATPDIISKFTGGGSYSCHYNELNYLRFNNEIRQQPDYLVAFKVNENIENEQELLRAQREFNGIPIVVIDVNMCIEKTKKDVIDKINNYNTNHSSELGEEIFYEILRNRKICKQYNLEDFLPDVDISIYLKDSLQEKKSDLIDIKESMEEMKNYLEDEKKEMGM